MLIEGDSASPVAGWYLTVPEANATVILLHPLHGDRRAMLSRARMLHEAGYGALLIDLPGHGETPSETLTLGWRSRLAVIDAVQFARRREPEHRIAVIGWSLGGASAVLASPLPIDALVLESVYPTIEGAIHNRIALRAGEGPASAIAPLLLRQLRVRRGVSPANLRPIDRMGDVGCPILVLAGDHDARTTGAETQDLFDSAPNPKELIWFPGAGHVDLLAEDQNRWKTSVLSFLAVHLPGDDHRP